MLEAESFTCGFYLSGQKYQWGSFTHDLWFLCIRSEILKLVAMSFTFFIYICFTYQGRDIDAGSRKAGTTEGTAFG